MQVGFGSGAIWAELQQYLDGSVPAAPTIAKVGTLQEWSMDIQWDTKQLYGGFDSPVAIGRGKAKYPLKFKFAELHANMFQAMLFGASGQPVGGETLMAENESRAVPGSPAYTIAITPPNSGTFVKDWGVLYSASGLVLTKVSGSPAQGQYSVSGSTYTFAALSRANGASTAGEAKAPQNGASTLQRTGNS
jgi:hypothetical protein